MHPPLNPPGEAGLGAPVASVAAPVEPVVAPEPAPKARRGRKPRAAEAAPVEVGTDSPGFDEGHPGGGGAPVTNSDPRNPTRGYSLEEQLAFSTTDELVDALIARGYTVTITKSEYKS